MKPTKLLDHICTIVVVLCALALILEVVVL